MNEDDNNSDNYRNCCICNCILTDENKYPSMFVDICVNDAERLLDEKYDKD